MSEAISEVKVGDLIAVVNEVGEPVEAGPKLIAHSRLPEITEVQYRVELMRDGEWRSLGVTDDRDDAIYACKTHMDAGPEVRILVIETQSTTTVCRLEETSNA